MSSLIISLTAVEPVTSLTDGGVTWTFAAPVQAGVDQTGRAYAVAPSGGTVTITAITPNQTTQSGLIINGAQADPTMQAPGNWVEAQSKQGYDERLTSWDATVNLTLPVSLGAGRRVIKAISSEEFDETDPDGPFWRDGSIDQYSSLHIVSAAPTATQVLGPSVTFPSDALPEVYDFNLNAVYASRTTYSAANITWPTYEYLCNTAGQYWPSYPQLPSQSQYEQLGPRGFGGTAGVSSEVNYGEDMALRVGELMLATTLDPADPDCPYTEAEIKNLMLRVLRNGLSWGLPIAYAQSTLSRPDGGTQQHQHAMPVLALNWLGLSGKVSDFLTYVRGNWLQAFIMQQADLADFAPHSQQYLPFFSRRRTLPAQTGGNVVTIEFDVDGFANGFDMQRDAAMGVGTRIVRESDGVTAVTTAGFSVPNSSGTPTLDVPIASALPFSAGDVVYMESALAEPIQAGTPYWTLRGYLGDEKYAFSPVSSGYQGLQEWGGSLVALRAHGIPVEQCLPQFAYFEVSSVVANFPSASNTFPTLVEKGLAPQYIAENWQTSWSVLTAPEAFVVGNWTLDAGGNVSVLTLPSNGGRFITGLKYSLNGGALQAVAGLSNMTTIASRTIDFTIPSYAGEDVRIYAVNALGDSAASDAKSAT